jgi:TetR/AcrR family tetracycline transcriptional repressor
MAAGLRERTGSTVEDDFRYALGIMLAGLRATRPTRARGVLGPLGRTP